MPAAYGRLTDIPDLIRRVRGGDMRAVARLISVVENDATALGQVVAALAPDAGRAWVVGLTGAPGVGKSTSVSALITELRAAGRRVGVLAVDPSSPFSRGALLGDRIRMRAHTAENAVYIRSMASRGHLGGLSVAVPQAVRVLEAAGFDTVLIETVGVGQGEFEIASMADTTILILAPGLGDGVQAAKAGILEVADVFAVNKADREGADLVARDLRQLAATKNGWRRPIVMTVAARDEGFDGVLAAVTGHRRWLEETGMLSLRRRGRARAEIESIVLASVRLRLASPRGSVLLGEAAARVAQGGADACQAAREILESLL
ncbi:methylmalonyl Co-A mutase-associated GTPase MeaB [Nonomuraea jiangxiensis]|nr:methylmalonyl Co-A mutase-associated GTPase MeaB [Nonomuraea jiangxiensis]